MSTVLYGAHIWGLRYLKEIETVQYHFHRRLLSLPYGTSGHSMRLELGRSPLCTNVAKNALNFLSKTMQLEEG